MRHLRQQFAAAAGHHLYQLHRIDPKVPVERQLDALKDLQAEGKIKHIGLSEVSVRQLHDARTVVSIASVQNRYSVMAARPVPLTVVRGSGV